MPNIVKSRCSTAGSVAFLAVCLPVLLSAQSQSIGTGRTFPRRFQFSVTDTSGNPVVGQPVSFFAPLTGGSGGTFAGSGVSATVTTDGNGVATAPAFTANSIAGTYSVRVGGGVLTFSLTNLPCQNNPMVTSNADDGPGTLRAAIQTACPGSTITFSSVSSPIKLATGLRIDDDLIIQGPGSGTLAIDGQGQTRLFFIGGGNVTISALTLQNGKGQGGGSNLGGAGAGMGGAMFVNGGSVTLTSVLFTGNLAQGVGYGSNDGGGGYGGDAPSPVSPPVSCDPSFCYGSPPPAVGVGLNGADGGDLLGSGGNALAPGHAGNGGIGAGGAASLSAEGGAGGFGGGGGFGGFLGGKGGLGGGGGGSTNVVWSVPQGGRGGFAAGPGYALGGGGAGFGGAIFVRVGTFALSNVYFVNNTARGGANATGAHDRGGALFIFNDLTPGANTARAYDFGGNQFQGNLSYSAGFHEGTPYGYRNPTTLDTCPGVDTADVCGILTPVSMSQLAGNNQNANLLSPLAPIQVQPLSGIPIMFVVHPGSAGAGATFAGGSLAQTGVHRQHWDRHGPAPDVEQHPRRLSGNRALRDVPGREHR